MARPAELTGKRFGKLLVLSLVGTDEHGNRLWRCKCNCGRECTVKSRQLMSEGLSCCAQLKGKPGRRRLEIIGRQFHRLTVLREGPPRPKTPGRSFAERRFYCRCECGAVALVAIGRLTRGTSKSCGSPKCRAKTRAETLRARAAMNAVGEPIVITPEMVADQTLRDAGGYGGRNNRLTVRETAHLIEIGYLPKPKNYRAPAVPFVRAL